MMANDDSVAGQPLNHRFLSVNGQKLHFIDWSPSGGQAIILLHGIAMHARVWDEFAASLDYRYRPVAIDLRGHGESDWSVDQRYDRMTMAEDVSTLICEIEVESPVFIGHSLGGAVGLMSAAICPQHLAPKAIVMIDSSLSRPLGASKVGRFLDQSPTSFESLDAMIHYAGTLAKGRTRTQLRNSVLKNARQLVDGRWNWKYDPVLITSRRETSSDVWDQLWHELEALTIPLLYLKASHNSHLQPDQERRLQSINPLVKLVEIPNTSHSVMRDNLTDSRSVILEFLESLGH